MLFYHIKLLIHWKLRESGPQLTKSAPKTSTFMVFTDFKQCSQTSALEKISWHKEKLGFSLGSSEGFLFDHHIFTFFSNDKGKELLALVELMLHLPQSQGLEMKLQIATQTTG